jgi:hypothetical protein
MAIRPSRAYQMPTMIIMRPANKITPAAKPLVALPLVICGFLLCLILRAGPRASPVAVSVASSHQAQDWRAANPRR